MLPRDILYCPEGATILLAKGDALPVIHNWYNPLSAHRA